ncbi:MAG: hypothetical protein CMP86_15445 [Gammaproteobacteria bacterium]|nr:hypothetical protein [Gammaproteobacteria bacterium]
MIDAVVGAVIMVIATTSLLSAVEVIEMAFSEAGRQPLSPQEEQFLKRAGLDQDRRLQFWQDSLVTLPRELISQKSE